MVIIIVADLNMDSIITADKIKSIKMSLNVTSGAGKITAIVPAMLVLRCPVQVVTMIRKSNILMCAIVLLAPYAASAAPDADQSKPAKDLSNFMLTVINADRAKDHSPPVVEDPALSRLAQTYAEYLMRTKRFDHVDGYGRDPQQRAGVFGINAPIAENLAYQMDTDDSAKTLLKKAQADMMSEPRHQQNHRANITNPAHRFVGIGIAQKDDKVILVQEYTEDKP